ncbi:cold inducible RNA binding protein a isoform X3 [Channa argus]|uniref:cold inducible RNA binding protein a isoform X3 n=1 Tax=Channa argus TaxID=215402 RepID=UPI003522DF7E
MAGLFVWMKQERVDVLEEVSVQAQEVVDSAGPGEEVAVVTHEEVEDTMETEDMGIGAMVTEALVVGRGALVVVVVDTGVEDTPQEEEVTEKTEVRVAMVTAPDHTGMDMTAMNELSLLDLFTFRMWLLRAVANAGAATRSKVQWLQESDLPRSCHLKVYGSCK